MKVAIAHGENLPNYADQESARIDLFARRDRYLELLSEACKNTEVFEGDFVPESLKSLEKWYFELWDAQSFWDVGLARSEFETAMAMYYGEVFVRNSTGFEWIVTEFAFQLGKYELGVKKDLVTVMLSRFTDLFAHPNNKKRQSVWTEYQKYRGSVADDSSE